MSHIAYVNGSYVPHMYASTHIEDRGYQFADGMYEYVAFYNGKLLDGEPHFERMERSLEMLEMVKPLSRASLRIVIRELIARNSRRDGGLYIQVTRGIARRDHPFPKTPVAPVLCMTICGAKTPKASERENGVNIITRPDIRWGRCDIKSISLLPNILAKQQAAAQGCKEAWLVKKDGNISEGSASNAYLILPDGKLITHPNSNEILPGITRDVVLQLARDNGISVNERPFALSEIETAKEAFMTSTSANVLPVVTVDGKPIGNGHPGETTRKLATLYNDHIEQQTGKRLA